MAGSAGRALGAAAAIAPLLAAGAHADDAAAKTFTVSSKRADGKGTLRKALRQADRHKGRDRIVFRSRLSGKVKLQGNVKIKEPLTIAGPGRGRLAVEGSASGSGLTFRPRFRSNRKKSPASKLVIRDLRMDRVFLSAGAGPSDLRLIDSRLSGEGIDHAGVANGGSYGDSPLLISGSTIEGFDGGGVDLTSTFEAARIRRSVISGNSFGVYLFKASATIKNSTVSDNSPRGGVSATYYSFVGVAKSTISGNRSTGDADSAATGGGVDAYYEAFARISNSTISGNSADGPGSVGGGIYGSASVTSSTVTENSAENGGGIFNAPGFDDGVSVTDSVVAGNQAATGADCGGEQDSGGPPKSKGGNVFGPGGCGTPAGSDVLTELPLLGPLANNGGPTFTHELRKGSPAINHSGKTDIETDQRGVRRGDKPDSGAFERR